MGDAPIDLSNAYREIFFFDAPDDALESAAAPMRDNAGAMTLAFCSGLDVCSPKSPVISRRR